jgi:hypothetical protein
VSSEWAPLEAALAGRSVLPRKPLPCAGKHALNTDAYHALLDQALIRLHAAGEALGDRLRRNQARELLLAWDAIESARK